MWEDSSERQWWNASMLTESPLCQQQPHQQKRTSGSATVFLLQSSGHSTVICGKAAAKVENFQLALYWPVISLTGRLEQKMLLMEMGFTLLLSNMCPESCLFWTQHNVKVLTPNTAIHREDEGWNTYSLHHTKCFSLSTHTEPGSSSNHTPEIESYWRHCLVSPCTPLSHYFLCLRI